MNEKQHTLSPDAVAALEAGYHHQLRRADDFEAALVMATARIAELEKAAASELHRCRNFLRGLSRGSNIWHMFTAIELGLMEAVEPEAYRALMEKSAAVAARAGGGAL